MTTHEISIPEAVPPASDELLTWLRAPRGGSSRAWTLEQLQRSERPDLPERVVEALLNGQIDGSWWFGAADVLEWLAVISPPSARRVPARFFEAHLDDASVGPRHSAARGLAMTSPARAITAFDARIGSKKATDRDTAFALAHGLLTAADADRGLARTLLPRLEAAAGSMKGKTAKLAALVVEAATKLAGSVDTSALPDRDDLGASIARTKPDAAIDARLLLGLSTLDGGHGSHAEDRRLGFDVLAGISGLSIDEVKSHGARLAADPTQRLGWSERGLYWQDGVFRESDARPHPVTHELGISPWALEKLVLARDTAKLNDVLAPWARAPLAARHASSASPVLKWIDGTPLSRSAQSFFLASHASPSPWRSIAELLTTILDDDASFELGRWLLADGKAHAEEHFLLPPSHRMACELGQAAAHDLLPRALAEYHGLETVPAFRRWLVRTWATQPGSWRSSYPRPSTLLFRAAPSDEDLAREQPGSVELWERLLADALEEAMVAQRELVAYALDRLLAVPLVRRAARGVVLSAADRGLVWVDDAGLRDARGPVRLDGHLGVRVAHPLVHGALPDTGRAPFAQHDRPTFDAVRTDVSLPKALWRERTHALGYSDKVTIPGEGRSRGAWRGLVGTSSQLVIDHGGLTGSRVQMARAYVQTLYPVTALETSELALDVHRLAGDRPITTLPTAPLPPLPEVLSASSFGAR